MNTENVSLLDYELGPLVTNRPDQTLGWNEKFQHFYMVLKTYNQDKESKTYLWRAILYQNRLINSFILSYRESRVIFSFNVLNNRHRIL